MSLISREAAIDAIDKNRQDLLSLGMNGAEHILVHYGRRVIENLPNAEKVGKWMEQERGIHTTKYRCSECGRVVWDDTGYDVCTDYPYCNCGARMEGEE